MSERRPKRRCVATKAQAPSAIHYVGYVEDDETPEMIMKKFEELERIKKAAEARRHQQQNPQQAQQPEGDAHPPAASAPFLADACAAGATADGAPSAPVADAPPSDPGSQTFLQQQQQPTDPQHAQHDHRIYDDADGPSRTARFGGDEDDQILLDEEALLEVFKQTSTFNVRSALSNNELLRDGGGGGTLLAGGGAARYDAYGVAYGTEDLLFAGGEVGGAASDPEDEELQLLKGFWSDEDFELGGRSRDAAAGARRRKAAGRAAGAGGARSEGGDGAPREPKQPRANGGAGGQSRHAMHQVVMQYNRDTNALIRRRVTGGGSGGGGGELVQLRVPPPPLPLSWGRTVRPYQPPEPYKPPTTGPNPAAAAAAAGSTGGDAPAPAITDADAAVTSRGFESADLTSFPFDAALGSKTYVAIMVNAQWQPPGASDAFEQGGEAEVMRRFRSLPIPRLCPRGFVLVWAHKGLLQAVCRALSSWGYVYVENLTWVHLTPANAISGQPGRHFRRSHSTLLMFRREGEGRDIELRHQRNPDVVFDCIRCLPGGDGWDLPAEVLTTIETMLPASKGSFLELWAPKGHRRSGWDHICEVK